MLISFVEECGEKCIAGLRAEGCCKLYPIVDPISRSGAIIAIQKAAWTCLEQTLYVLINSA